MAIRLHSLAVATLAERGATEQEILTTVVHGETFPAKYGRTGFRRNFEYDDLWRGKHYPMKQIEAYAVHEGNGWLVNSFVTKFF